MAKILHNFSLWQVLQFIYWLTFHSGFHSQSTMNDISMTFLVFIFEP